jgi:hypothetical protein
MKDEGRYTKHGEGTCIVGNREMQVHGRFWKMKQAEESGWSVGGLGGMVKHQVNFDSGLKDVHLAGSFSVAEYSHLFYGIRLAGLQLPQNNYPHCAARKRRVPSDFTTRRASD